jgi:uncharacterized membrane protein
MPLLPSALSAPSLSPTHRRPLFALFRPEYVYPGLLLVWGAVLALVLPPMQCPDEGSHAIRCFHLSRGRLLPDGVADGFHTGRVPASLNQLFNVMCPRTALNSPQRYLTADEFRYFRSIRLQTDPEAPTWFGMLSYTCFVPYVPQAAGIYLVRKLDGSVLTAFYAGRLANLLVCVLALHLALRLMPFYRNVLGAVALLPVSVQQMATLSADALGIAACFLFTALVFRLIVPSERRPGTFTLLILCGTALVLPLCKIPFALLTLLYLGVRPARLGSWRKYLLLGAALAAMTLLGVYITLKASEGATHLGEGVPEPEVSRTRQVEYLCQHPEAFFEALGRTLACWGWGYCESLTLLSGNVFVCSLAAKAYLLFLALMALIDRRQGWHPGFRVHLLALLTGALAVVMFHLMLYLVWTRVASPVVDGFQGRYFIGFLPVGLLLFYNRLADVQSGPRALLALTVAAATGVQLATLHTLLCTYYLAPGQLVDTEPNITSVLLTGGLLFMATLVLLNWRALRAEARLEQLSGLEPLPASLLPPAQGVQAAARGKDASGLDPKPNGQEETEKRSPVGLARRESPCCRK